MDILKVLSRGTKKKLRGTGPGTASSADLLPSAGSKTNPQLYHDPVPGQKRKRTPDERPAPSTVADDLPDVDFFAAQDDAPPSSRHGPPEAADRAASPDSAPAQRLSEEECRQVLRSHRLKITLLSRQEARGGVGKPMTTATHEQARNKEQRGEQSAAEVKKETRRQLYPQPLASFGELRRSYGISRRLAENLVVQGYRTPTEVQLGSLPLLLRPELALAGDEGLGDAVNFLANAPTGSGKTLSFFIPVMNSLMRRRASAKLHGVHELEAIIMAPTRELAYQIAQEGQKLAHGTGLRVVAMRKGMRLAAEEWAAAQRGPEQDDEADEAHESDESEDETLALPRSKPMRPTLADILVTTPLLLLNFLTSGQHGDGKLSLPTVRELVLDEADVLLDPLFREQTMGTWMACTHKELRLSCWSATMGSSIESLVADQIKAHAASSGVASRPLVRLVVGLKDTAVPTIKHKLIYTATEQGKLLGLRQLLRPASGDDSGPPLRPPFLVFTQTIERAASLHDELKYDIPLEAGGASRIAALHGGLSDSARAAIMRKFRAGDIWVLIATDVLARGVDFAGVNGVVNYDVPGSSAAYVHRVGRTGRAGREGGVAVTFYTKDDIPFVKTTANVIAASEKQAGGRGPAAESDVQGWLLAALPDVTKADKKRLKERGVEARRSGSKAQITSRSGYDRQKEHNRRGAIEGSRRRKTADRERPAGDGEKEGDAEEWDGFGD